MIRADGTGPGPAAKGQLTDHDDEAHKYRQQQIDDEEREAAGAAHLVRKAPDISKTHRGADSGHQETDIAAPSASVIFHKQPLFLSNFMVEYTMNFRRGQGKQGKITQKLFEYL